MLCWASRLLIICLYPSNSVLLVAAVVCLLFFILFIIFLFSPPHYPFYVRLCLTIFAATQSTSVILDGGASNAAAYGYRHVTSDGSTLTLADTARLYMMNTNGNAYQVPTPLFSSTSCSSLPTLPLLLHTLSHYMYRCSISSTKSSATTSILLWLVVEEMQLCISIPCPQVSTLPLVSSSFFSLVSFNLFV